METPLGLTQVVALDECDPTTFDAALSPDYCKIPDYTHGGEINENCDEFHS